MAEQPGSEIYHARDDSSAWGGNALLAFVVGELYTALRLQGFGAEMPQGYAPVVDVLRHGRRFRLKVEEVTTDG